MLHVSFLIFFWLTGAPGEIRTPDLLIRSPFWASLQGAAQSPVAVTCPVGPHRRDCDFLFGEGEFPAGDGESVLHQQDCVRLSISNLELLKGRPCVELSYQEVQIGRSFVRTASLNSKLTTSSTLKTELRFRCATAVCDMDRLTLWIG